MTTDRLAEIEARCEAALHGPVSLTTVERALEDIPYLIARIRELEAVIQDRNTQIAAWVERAGGWRDKAEAAESNLQEAVTVRKVNEG